MEGIQLDDISIVLGRVLAVVPLYRLLVCWMFPRGYRKSSVGLPIIQNFGVNARSRTSTPAVHTGEWESGGGWEGRDMVDLEGADKALARMLLGIRRVSGTEALTTTKSTDRDAEFLNSGQYDFFRRPARRRQRCDDEKMMV